MSTITCTHCSATGLEPGFLDEASHPTGFTRWIEGDLGIGAFGRMIKEKKRFRVSATRCPDCGHLELFATHPSG
ncbi:hypothetical protein [Streptomyces sp. NPDC060031]|uniref:hypothetical protein n=1 Tax=Streptomyces sp. NPDC060031 TaxID=3347043 RepID=UPI0036A24E4D